MASPPYGGCLQRIRAYQYAIFGREADLQRSLRQRSDKIWRHWMRNIVDRVFFTDHEPLSHSRRTRSSSIWGAVTVLTSIHDVRVIPRVALSNTLSSQQLRTTQTFLHGFAVKAKVPVSLVHAGLRGLLNFCILMCNTLSRHFARSTREIEW
ncbi:uncharacterized protein EDB91DRAFT_145735 [Suillus paluster]|uniref:uncharacterized protein n=1 Tax=Suillus paluster TaxID=48578 RepID=UPI001B882285|nr:uncharacterized protein EDB91DRAFT_145735 [Suillus paluster]KAG1745351.1 hypothetical protein EDB91DRAFT_145735 [Suillus paluster]